MEQTEETSGAGGGTGSPDVQRGLGERTGQATLSGCSSPPTLSFMDECNNSRKIVASSSIFFLTG